MLPLIVTKKITWLSHCSKRRNFYLGCSFQYLKKNKKKKPSPGAAATVKCVGLKGGELQGTHEVTCRGTQICVRYLCRLCILKFLHRVYNVLVVDIFIDLATQDRILETSAQSPSYLLGERQGPAAAHCYVKARKAEFSH